MIDSIATSLAGLQTAAAQVNKAAAKIASPSSYDGIQDVVEISNATGEASGQVAANVAEGSLEASVVGLKVAANLYKANAAALDSILTAQKEAFEQLI